jgi:thiamine-phosphate pyrophosphorylase
MKGRLGMSEFYRILDVNVNRASEGLRVIEDIMRLYYNETVLTEKIRLLRHRVRKLLAAMSSSMLKNRDTEGDVGFGISAASRIDIKNRTEDLIAANMKRVQEAIRVIEEILKASNQWELSKEYETARYECYILEKDFFFFNTKINKRKKLDTDMYCIIGEKHSNGRSNIEVTEKLLDSDIKIIQYREKNKSQAAKLEECRRIREMTLKREAAFIVNDDIDIALLVEADGVHIGQDDIPLPMARMLLGHLMIIGVSTHSPEQADRAVKGGADYIGVGPIFKTFTKKDVCEPVGLQYLDYIVKQFTIPFVAIGGIKLHNLTEVCKRGAKLVSLVTEIIGADDIVKTISEVRKIMKENQKGD